MTDNARKVFDMLGVEPGERFNLKSNLSNSLIPATFWIDDDLKIKCIEIPSLTSYHIDDLLNGTFSIVKIPRKKKLRDLTPEEYVRWRDKNCSNFNGDNLCEKCLFYNAYCWSVKDSMSWIYHKDLYSDKFLNQEIEIPEEAK